MLKINIEVTKGILFVRLSGKLTIKNIKKFDNEVTTLLKKAGIKNIVFNINELDYIDNYGKQELCNSFKICHQNQGQVFVVQTKNKIKPNNIPIINDELSALKLINV